jgi:hypothetical protein
MYTHEMAERLIKVARPGGRNRGLVTRLNAVQDKALKASSLGAEAAMDMFAALDVALKSDDPEIRKAAEKIMSGPFYQIIA